MSVSFDRPVDRASVAERFHIVPSLPGCEPRRAFAATAEACRIVWAADSTSFRLEHARSLFAADVKYHFSLDAGFRDPTGAVNGLDHGWELTAAIAPTLNGTIPSDGARDVSVDTTIGVNFSAVMNVGRTAAAIHLEPPVPGTRVVANSRDHARFVILPGRLLAAGTTYTVRIGSGAVEEHGQALDGPRTARITTGGLVAGNHALVLGRRAGELPSVVQLTGRLARQPGEPAAAATVLEAPRCAAAACGQASRGSPTEAYLAATLSERGSQLAVVVRDLTADRPDEVDLVALPSGARRVLGTGAGHPAWSPDGRRLAYGAGTTVAIHDVGSGRTASLPAGDALDAAPTWSADGSTLALPVRSPSGETRIELADPTLLIRYPVPGLGGALSDPVLSADGSRLALRREGASGAGAWLISLRTGDASPRAIGADLTPIAFVDAGTLLAVQRPEDGPPGVVRVTLSGGDVTRLAAGPRASDLATVRSDSRGRAIGFLLPDAEGIVQAWTANADGSNPSEVTGFPPGGDEAVSISLT